MKHLNEIGRIKELMSLINEGEGLKFLERLLLRGETNSIKKAEGAIDDVIKVWRNFSLSATSTARYWQPNFCALSLTREASLPIK